MNPVNDMTPVIAGIAEVVEPLQENLAEASSPLELAAQAARLALADAGDAKALAAQIDVLACVRTMDDSAPIFLAPFGTSNNPPRSVARRIGASPRLAIHAKAGGDTPQRLVNEWCEKLAAGQASVVLLTGGEARATAKAAMKAGILLDWSEQVEGELEDRGYGVKGMAGIEEVRHGLLMPPTQYAVCENARRAQLGLDVESYQRAMGELFAPFSVAAEKNPFSMFRKSYTASEIAAPGDKNPYIDYPYTRAMVAKESVNQAAALLLTTVGKARELGIPEDQLVYLHGYAQAEDLPLLKRENLGASVALGLAYQHALACAGVSSGDIEYFDLYSCFPIAVWLAKEALQLGNRDVGLTQTGGLPFFGGPGSNYSMHGIAATVRRLRGAPQSFGLVGAIGGMFGKHAVGIYSRQPGWQFCDSTTVQQQVNDQPRVTMDFDPDGEATVESYTVSFQKGKPVQAVVVGRMKRNHARFLANVHRSDEKLLEKLLAEDMAGAQLAVRTHGRGNTVALDRKTLNALLPQTKPALQASYEFATVEVREHVLELTINRPESYNALHPMANEELSDIFDAYMADDNLWVAIITGAGEKAFCTGNDLKYSASGKPMWIPKSGYGGLTSRKGRNKPVIAAVNGFAMGGGMEIALACDMVVAADNAVFALPEVKRGLIAAAGGSLRLTRQLPLKKAMEILLTGRDVLPAEALELGIINRVVPRGEALAAAREIADTICQNSPSSIRLTMDLIAEKASISDPAEAAASHGAAFDALIASEDFYEGPKAFAEKRAPKWKGR